MRRRYWIQKKKKKRERMKGVAALVTVLATSAYGFGGSAPTRGQGHEYIVVGAGQ